MNARLSPSALLELVNKEITRRQAETSLYEFVKQSWHVVEPGIKFIESWHIREICEHLEAVSSGEIRRLLINIPPRHALRLGTLIPTTRGFKSVEDLAIGDLVFGVDGRPIPVLGKSEVFKHRQIFRCWTDDETYIDTDAEHLWTVRLCRKEGIFHTYTSEQLWMREQGYYLRTKRGGGVDLRPASKTQPARPPMLPMVGAVEYPSVELPIPPYVLGSWLGDGSKSCGRISCHILDQPETRAAYESLGVRTTDLSVDTSFGALGLRTKLRDLGVLYNKHIPRSYLQASVSQRWELLRGLMDTDGSASKSGQLKFSQKSESFIDDVCELLRSLGIKAFKAKREAKIGDQSYGLHFKVSFHAQNVFKLSRKENRTKKTPLAFGRYLRVERLDEYADTQCISVGSDDGLFQAGRGYICTHNSKSTIVSVMWPVWEWIAYPSAKFLCASYSGVLSTRDNLKARRLVQSPWYQERWGHLFQLAGDQNAKQRFENNKTGYRIATSVGGTATGEGGSRLILDDPHGAQAAQSEAIRGSDLEWFDQVWSTRLNNPKTDAMVVVMQRLHQKDVSGHILEDLGGWEHIKIPAEWDGVRRRTSLGPYDPRETVGELICPERFGPEEITRLKQLLGVYGASGQLQQDPSPADGGILKPSFFRLWPHDKRKPPLEYIIQSYDTAFTEHDQGDPTGCEVWGFFVHEKVKCAILLDCWDEHLSYPELRKRVIEDWTSEYGADSAPGPGPITKGRRPDRILVEAKASGQSLLQDLRLAKVPAVGYNPGKADKITRAHQAAPTLEMGMLWIPESKKNPGQPVSWAVRMMNQIGKFPTAEHDEYVDTLTQTVIYAKNDGLLGLPEAKDMNEAVPQKPRINPYAQ